MRVGYSSWSIDPLDTWSVTQHPECLTLEMSEEGALQFSSALKGSGDVTQQDLLFSEEERVAWGDPADVAFGQFSGIVYEYVESDSTWTRWFLRNASTLLFVTYNGSPSVAERERPEVERVLSSLQVESQGAA
jgi:hypothetical protein